MRPDDHQVVADRPIAELVFPNDLGNAQKRRTRPAYDGYRPRIVARFDEKLMGRGNGSSKTCRSGQEVEKPAAPAKK